MKIMLIVWGIGLLMGITASWAWQWPRTQEWRQALKLRVLSWIARLKGSGGGQSGEGNP